MKNTKIEIQLRNILKKFWAKIFKSDLFFQDEIPQLERIIEIEYGHLKSKETKQSIDGFGNPIPWFTYPTIEYLKQLDIKNFSCLEWGCGNSTLFFAQITKYITSIEDDLNWQQAVNDQIKYKKIANVELILAKNELEYISPPLKKKYDLIIIDGKYRKECIETAFKVFSERGFIILDNSNRHPDLCKIIRDKNLLQVDFIGHGPIVDFTTQTSLFFTSKSITNIEIEAKLPIIGNPNNY